LNGTSDSTRRYLRGSTVSGVFGGTTRGSHNHAVSVATLEFQAISGGTPAVISVNLNNADSEERHYDITFITRIK
jgi:hypothetical protein